MSLPEYILIALCAVYLLYLAGEKLLLSRCRSSFVHVIHVNGIRGKSSTVRLIDAGLRGGSVRVLSKSTGTLPMILHVDGREEQIERRAPANIREQRDMMRLARRERAQVLVVECMAIHPEGQRASEDMLRADLAVVTNVRPDHTDVMGETREEICDALLSMRPHKGDLFTCEADMAPRMEKAMAGRGRVFVIEPRPDAEGPLRLRAHRPWERGVFERLLRQRPGLHPEAVRSSESGGAAHPDPEQSAGSVGPGGGHEPSRSPAPGGGDMGDGGAAPAFAAAA